jgi:DNA invertase Pin-like site-specific DNA recombinase
MAAKPGLSLMSSAPDKGFEIAGEYLEVETGKGADALDRRPELAAALAEAKRVHGAVVVAKLDRLSRDVAFISGLMMHRVRFVLADLGQTLSRSSFTCSPRSRKRSAP